MAFFFPSITIPFRHPSQIIRTRITARTFENLPSPGSIFLDFLNCHLLDYQLFHLTISPLCMETGTSQIIL